MRNAATHDDVVAQMGCIPIRKQGLDFYMNKTVQVDYNLNVRGVYSGKGGEEDDNLNVDICCRNGPAPRIGMGEIPKAC